MTARNDNRTPAPARHGNRKPRRIVMVAFPKAQMLDITGPLEILAAVNDEIGDDSPAYEIEIAAARKGPLTAASGLRLHADRAFADYTPRDLARIHTLMVAGGEGTYAAMKDDKAVRFLARAGTKAERVASICSGTFLLAAAGLVSTHRVTTHWSVAGRLRRQFPGLKVEEDAIYVRDGNVWSSAGITTGMDLALALVNEDWGPDIALSVARRFVIYMIRPGGQSQFSAHLIAQAAGGSRTGPIAEWIIENPTADLSVPALANRAGMSERSFARHFQEEIGMSPGRFVETARIETARLNLERSGAPIDRIAEDSGFSNAEQMRRAFHRHLGISPNDYRARFRAPATQERPAPRSAFTLPLA